MRAADARRAASINSNNSRTRSEEHTSELQSPCNLVCRLLLEKKKMIRHSADVGRGQCSKVSRWQRASEYPILLLSAHLSPPHDDSYWYSLAAHGWTSTLPYAE